jgi:predicted dehydrogenase
MGRSLTRRDVLKTLGLSTAGATLSPTALADLIAQPIEFPPHPLAREIEKPVTAIVAGAGNRGNVYSGYALKFPSELKIVGFAEPIPFRRERFSRRFNIPAERQFTTWEQIFELPKFADAVIITTPDALHYGPAMAALEKGYDLILEKAIAQSWSQCSDILNLARQKGRIVAICHVLRYAPFFRKVKDVVSSGAIGNVVSVQLMEPVHHIHMAHSFIRGNWRNSQESNPMLLSKSCHDLDLLVWLMDKHCERIGSFGKLSWFNNDHAPAGNTSRCTDGCAVEADCPYSALKIYYRKRNWLFHMDLPEEGDKGPAILENLKKGPYGRCVYHCDNDVVDHQTVMMEFEGGVTATFNMEALTSYGGRRIRIMGTEGDLVGDEDDLYVSNFKSEETARWNVKEHADVSSGHGGGDYGLVRDFIQAVSQHNPSLLATTIENAMESHLMAFRAEEGRTNGTIELVGRVK